MLDSAGRSASTSLIDEVREQRARAELERERIRKRDRRRAIVLTTFTAIALVIAAILVRHLAQRERIERRLHEARTALASGRPGDLERAAAFLDLNLGSQPGHGESLGLLALVRVHQFAEGTLAAEAVHADIERAATAGCPEASFAQGVIAGLQGDLDQARRTYEAAAAHAPELEDATRNDVVWLRGVTALGRPNDKAMIEAALAEAEPALDRTPGWIPTRRITAALRLRIGRSNDALATLEAGREQEPAHLGLAVDEALLHALLGRELAGAQRAAEALLARPELPPGDRGYAELALAAVLFHDGEGEAAREHWRRAWQALPAWDNHTRDLAIDVALSHGAIDLAESPVSVLSFGPEADAIHRGWLALVRGDSTTALTQLATAPQDLPRVAQLQALALVEQRRFEEARTWLDYAERTQAHRVDLQLARARTELQLGEAEPARTRLETLARENPYAWRVWTALAEARRSANDSEGAFAAALQAVDREPAPAEAYLLRAELRHEILRRDGFKGDEHDLEARADFAAAADANPHDARYRGRLGLHLAFLGFDREAREELRKAAESPTVEGTVLLTLARLDTEASIAAGRGPAPGVPGLLQRAAATPIEPWRIEIEWARHELAQNTPEGWAAARARTQAILDLAPASVEGRLVQIEAMLAQDDTDAAYFSLQRGLRRTHREAEGRLHLAQARVEVAKGKTRRAASLAFKGWRMMLHEPAAPDELLAEAPFVASLWADLDQARGARTVGRELTAHVPFHVDAWLLRGTAEFADDSDDKGCEVAERALALAPEDARAVALHGDCLTHKLKFEEARKDYARAAELASGTPEAREYQRKAKR